MNNPLNIQNYIKKSVINLDEFYKFKIEEERKKIKIQLFNILKEVIGHLLPNELLNIVIEYVGCSFKKYTKVIEHRVSHEKWYFRDAYYWTINSQIQCKKAYHYELCHARLQSKYKKKNGSVRVFLNPKFICNRHIIDFRMKIRDKEVVEVNFKKAENGVTCGHYYDESGRHTKDRSEKNVDPYIITDELLYISNPIYHFHIADPKPREKIEITFESEYITLTREEFNFLKNNFCYQYGSSMDWEARYPDNIAIAYKNMFTMKAGF